MGLPGSGKTRLAKVLEQELILCGRSIMRFNADTVRTLYEDWDFSIEGRLRQAKRMSDLAESHQECDFVICDFIAPTEEARKLFSADWTIWVDTIKESRYNDTNELFEEPSEYDFRVTEQKAHFWADKIYKILLG